MYTIANSLGLVSKRQIAYLANTEGVLYFCHVFAQKDHVGIWAQLQVVACS